MIRYKMLGRDTNSSPVQYRTWIVNNQPDFTGDMYNGLKSGNNPLVDICAYIIYDDTVIADFNLPNALHWNTTKKVLPNVVADAQLAIIDGYVYLFGGKISNKIYRAPINNPTDWIDTGAYLPVPLYGSQLAIINDTIYLFGGNDGTATDHIFSASLYDPLTWIDHGSLLPNKIHNAQLCIINNDLFLLGGRKDILALDNIYVASSNNPLNWSDAGQKLPNPLYGSQVAIIEDSVYLFGGLSSPNNPLKYIYSAPLNDPTNWNVINVLPYPICNGQFFTVGNKGYLITPGAISFTDYLGDTSVPKSAGTRILRCNLSSPTQWVDTFRTVPGEISESQVAIIYDRIFLFGGSGSSVIFANASELKYKFGSVAVANYGNITRTQYNNTINKLDLFKTLGFAPWKTSYGS